MKVALVVIAVLICLVTFNHGAKPVIIDTDIGTDIDDTWAISFLLLRPDIDIKLIVVATHNTPERLKLLAKFLTKVNRTDIPIALGPQQDNLSGPQYGALYGWSADFDMTTYTGVVYPDGIAQISKTIDETMGTVSILALAPQGNIAAAMKVNPTFCYNVNIFAMQGSVFIGYNGQAPAVPEYNVYDNIEAAQDVYVNCSATVFAAPLDVTVFAQIQKDFYTQLRNSSNIITKVLLENYAYWLENCSWAVSSCLIPPNIDTTSSTLHDLVAAYMLIDFSPFVLTGENMIIDAKGDTLISNGDVSTNGAKARWTDQALKWKDFDGFCATVVKALA